MIPRSRQYEIQELADRIRSDLASHDCSWETWYDALAPLRAELRKLLISNGGSFTVDERITFRSLSPIAHRPNEQWPEPQLAMLGSMHRQLAERGIDLIVVPIPHKEQVTASLVTASQGTTSLIADADSRQPVDAYRESFYLQMLDAGIEVVDLRPNLIDAFDRFEHVYFDGADNHPADGLIQVAAEVTAQRLARYQFDRQFENCRTQPVRFGIPKARAGFPARAYTDSAYVATQVFDSTGGTLPTDAPDSPVLLLADSCARVPNSFGVTDANFISHFIRLAGVVPHTVCIGGIAPQSLNSLAALPASTFADKQVCVFLFGEHYLYLNRPDTPRLRWDDTSLA